MDVVTNGFGAWLGALLFKLLEKIFALELPLMNLVYLLIPLLWLNGLSLGGEIRRMELIGLPGKSEMHHISYMIGQFYKHEGLNRPFHP